MQRSFLGYLVVTLKGIAMGAADIVPGVSGGTIAFISGIYEELITSINNINLSLLKTLQKEGIAAAWKQANGNFLVALLAGIAISVISLSKGISWLLENQPILLWSFFFGLVLASIYFVAKQITKWSVVIVLALLAFAAIAYYITSLPPLSNTDSTLFLFFAGSLAICAMILPGISGAFILVLLGAYKTILDAVDNRDFKIIAVVGLGAIFGLLTFSRLLKWLFNHQRNLILAILTGFILGSLNKIWPWKQVLETTIIHNKEVILKEQNILPMAYEGNPQLLWAIVLMCIGFFTIILLEKLANTPNKE
ncbi:polyprenyl-phosphate transporter [Neptunitalea lumnitzerae]|uniref:DUF368 domain-containing protein n=1 Tax=Neptunitalea lumnitzerae TaxID=2965509 RepID=A0ABQ5MKG3_9FLAO|nr:DUF368 domain-containing protein [Neptunitalea sp. Y10]GLB49903.1 DUF368 domain-containing protein [Neptunitalea sp. Y10]